MIINRFRSLTWVSLVAILSLAACTPIAMETPAPQATPSAELANPASQNCIEQGGTLTIKARGDGGQFGVCTFEDNLQCEEWAMLRGDCPVGGIKVTGYATEAARYCAITGGEYQVDEAATAGADTEQGTCTLPGGQICNAWDYYNGECTPEAKTAETSESAQAAISDPFAYCATVGTDDSTVTDPGNGDLPDVLVQAMIDQNIVSADAPASIQEAAYWRCMDGNVWVCTVGANLPCTEKADMSETPAPAMDEFCQSNPGSDFIPAYVTGRATVYTWKCDGTTAIVDQQVFTPDAEGYLSEFWTELAPPQ